MKKPNGMGSVVKLSGKRRNPYAARVTMGYRADGTQIRKYIGYADTKRKAEMLLLEYYKNPNIANTSTLAEVYTEWSGSKFDKISPKTVAGYTTAWNRLQIFGDMQLREIKTVHLQKVVDDTKGMSRSTSKNVKNLCNQLYKFAIENDLAEKNYAEYVVLPTPPEKKTKFIFTGMEIKMLWENKFEPWVDSILFMLYTGDRVGSMLTIPKDKVHLSDRYIQHGNKTAKGKGKIMPIHRDLESIVSHRMDLPGKYLFAKENGEPVTVDHYRSYIFTPILKKLDINPKLTPHSCRHTFSTMLNKRVSNKKTISDLMGHTDYAITANWYTHSDIESMIEAVDTL